VPGEYRLAQVGYARCSRLSDLAAAAHSGGRSAPADEPGAEWLRGRRLPRRRLLLRLLGRPVGPAWFQAEPPMMGARVSAVAGDQAEGWVSAGSEDQPEDRISAAAGFQPMVQQCRGPLERLGTLAAPMVVWLLALIKVEQLRLPAGRFSYRVLVVRRVIA
jgi:hypothetical protein